MDARSLLDFGKWNWAVQAFLQWEQAEKSTTQPWDPSSSSSGCPDSLPTISLICFPRSMRLVYSDIFILTPETVGGGPCTDADPFPAFVGEFFLIQLFCLPPHMKVLRFVWRKPALTDTYRLSIIWQLFSLNLAGAKSTLGIEYPQVNITFFSWHTAAGVMASLGLYTTTWIIWSFA